METTKTQSRALQLAMLDISPKAKPPDTQIAELWGLSSDRSVREIRASDAYLTYKQELMNFAVSYAGEQVGEIVTTALSGLHALLPEYVARMTEMLSKPKHAADNWVIGAKTLAAVTTAMGFLTKLSALGDPNVALAQPEESVVSMPHLVHAQSEVEAVRQYREKQLTFTVREEITEGEVIEGEIISSTDRV